MYVCKLKNLKFLVCSKRPIAVGILYRHKLLVYAGFGVDVIDLSKAACLLKQSLYAYGICNSYAYKEDSQNQHDGAR